MKELMEARMARLEGGYEQISERLGSIDGRLTALDARVTALDEKVDRRFEAMDSAIHRRFEAVDLRFDRLDRKLTGMLVAWVGANAVLVAAVVGPMFAAHR
jgi:hypothetical protein